MENTKNIIREKNQIPVLINLCCTMSGLEGSLFKWINMVKGWQTRWFVLEPEISLLSYYTVSNFGQ